MSNDSLNIEVIPPPNVNILISESDHTIPISINYEIVNLNVIINTSQSLGLIVTPETYPSPSIIGLQGPRGSKGDTSFVYSYIIRPAGYVISGHRAVILNNDRVYYADHSDIDTAFYVAGVSLNSAMIDEDVEVVVAGEVEFNGWNWETGKLIYVGANGHLTQTMPTTGYVSVVAKAVTATKIFVGVQSPIILS